MIIMSDANQTALIVGSFSFAGIIAGGVVQIVLSYLGRKQVKAEIVAAKQETKADIGELRKNTDGMQAALLDLNARANRAEGMKEGVDEERARVPDLVIEPAAIETALHESGVRTQIDTIENAVTKKNGNGTESKP